MHIGKHKEITAATMQCTPFSEVVVLHKIGATRRLALSFFYFFLRNSYRCTYIEAMDALMPPKSQRLRKKIIFSIIEIIRFTQVKIPARQYQ